MSVEMMEVDLATNSGARWDRMPLFSLLTRQRRTVVPDGVVYHCFDSAHKAKTGARWD
ncbi:hypothetical protein E2C01_081621 [Portunus trituberculatus]|uniref:Uncharacterized protein n=1 Tax=Portunus trituberculatus TaxID=210409 RepID=A0A5B7IWD2_PORTR|nr:hypothetical protein [Portunus trituberculatus]